MSIVPSLLFAAFLLLGNAFFVGAEFAIITARRDRLDGLAERGSAAARTVMKAGSQLPLLIAGAQLGITICSLGLGALAEPAVASALEIPLHAVGLSGTVAHAIAFAVALLMVVYLHTVLGEMVPKNVALAGPERTALILVPAHYAFCKLVEPVLNAFTVVSNLILRLLKVDPKDELESAYTPDEFAELLTESRREGLLDDAAHRRLDMTLRSGQRTVADVLVPMAELTSVPERPTIGQIQEAVTATGYSRFPVRSQGGQLVGYVHVKDVLEHADEPEDTPLPASRVRGLPELPADARLDEALSALRRAHSHLAKAVSTSGTVLGVVAMEDLLEEYVGTVHDGTHTTQPAPA
ncbi:HlyC/CorC family transporter [Pseudonocardiaceae bacterium YIM PH 21723]|nr:HlyC/CorC family transporter [Pseudonocardiaceae bacterium YIM PH 21723]